MRLCECFDEVLLILIAVYGDERAPCLCTLASIDLGMIVELTSAVHESKVMQHCISVTSRDLGGKFPRVSDRSVQRPFGESADEDQEHAAPLAQLSHSLQSWHARLFEILHRHTSAPTPTTLQPYAKAVPLPSPKS